MVPLEEAVLCQPEVKDSKKKGYFMTEIGVIFVAKLAVSLPFRARSAQSRWRSQVTAFLLDVSPCHHHSTPAARLWGARARWWGGPTQPLPGAATGLELPRPLGGARAVLSPSARYGAGWKGEELRCVVPVLTSPGRADGATRGRLKVQLLSFQA